MLLNEHQGTKCSIFTIQGTVIPFLYKIDRIEAKTDPGRAGAPLLGFCVWGGCVFVNFKCIFFNYSQHAMCTICIIFSTRSHYKNIQGMYEGASKQSPNPKNSIVPGPRTQKFFTFLSTANKYPTWSNISSSPRPDQKVESVFLL